MKLTVPAPVIHGIKGQPLILPVSYEVNQSASSVQIIWLLERSQAQARYLITSINQLVMPDLELQNKLTINPPNASLLIYSLHQSDEGTYIVKVNLKGNTTVSAIQKIDVTVDGKWQSVLQYLPFHVTCKQNRMWCEKLVYQKQLDFLKLHYWAMNCDWILCYIMEGCLNQSNLKIGVRYAWGSPRYSFPVLDPMCYAFGLSCRHYIEKPAP